MKIDTQPLEDHQVKLTVEVEPKPFEESKQRAARKLARQVKIPGFRPGKAPYPVIVRHIGEPAIIEEAIEILVNDVYPEAIKEANIEAYGPGSLEQIISIDPPTFEFIVPLRAEVTLGDYHSIRLPYEQKEITPEMVEEAVKNLQERQAIIEPVYRPAQEGDIVRVQVRADHIDPVEDQPAALINNRPLSLVIETEESENPMEWPFQGFSRRLLGMSAGEETHFFYTFPEENEYESLRSIEAEFFLTIVQVSSRSLPDRDEEFAKSVGDYASMDELSEAIRQDLEKQTRDEYNQDYEDKILEEVIERSTIKYPPQMLEQEIKAVLSRLENNLAQQNLDIDLYLKTRQMDMDSLKDELKPIAETRLKKTLVLLEVAEAEKINVDPQALQSETSRTLNELSTLMEQKDFRSLIQTNENRSNLVSSIMMEMIISRTQERLREIAQGLEIAQKEGTEAGAEPAVESTTEPASAQTSGELIPVVESPVESEELSKSLVIDTTAADSDPEEIEVDTTGVEPSNSTLTDTGL